MMTEFELIARLKPLMCGNDFVVKGVGDDCAVLDLGAGPDWVLFKTDAVVEGVHFEPGTEGTRVGHKAVARCLSDLAAAGGSPTAALITLGLRDEFDPEYVEALYRGAGRLAARYQMAIVGGETTRSPDRFWVSVCVLGRVARGRACGRGGAKVGDSIWVTGELGGSRAGHHLDFEPRLREGAWLGSEFGVSAMMDLSDGLAGDLPHILSASGGLGAELLGAAIPIRREARLEAARGTLAKPALVAALTDGEDFELLFTVDAGRAVALLDAWRERFPGVRLSCIGKVVAEAGIRLRDKTGVRALGVRGFEHFR